MFFPYAYVGLVQIRRETDGLPCGLQGCSFVRSRLFALAAQKTFDKLPLLCYNFIDKSLFEVLFMESKRRDRDLVSIKRVIWSNYERFRTLGVFFVEKKEVLDVIAAKDDETIAAIAAECREGGVRWRGFTKYLTKIEKSLIGEREIVDLSMTDDRALEHIRCINVADFVKIIEKPSGVAVSFNVSGKFDVLAKGNRNGVTDIKAVGVTPETEFTVVDELLPFWEDRYSVALKSENLSFAISAEDPKTGKKGSACVRIYVIEDSRVVIDDLGKYTDTSALTQWINP